MTPLPANPEAERCVLSGFMADHRGVGALLAERNVTAAHFHGHQTVADHLLRAWADARTLDTTKLIVELRAVGTIADCGDVSGILDLAGFMPIPSAVVDYLDPLIEAHQLRMLAVACDENGQRAKGQGADPSEILARLTAATSEIAGTAQRATVKSLKALLHEKVERMENQTPDADMLKTGIGKLDAESPLRRGDMPLISGERKAGKSMLALNIAAHIAMSATVLYLSLEDRTPKVVDRLFAAESRIPILLHHVTKMTEGDMQSATRAVDALAKRRLIIRDDLFDLMPILAAIRQAKIKHADMAAAVVDYAQLVRVSLGKGTTREQEVAAVSRAFRLLAMELGIAILLLCQLNKDGDTRESKALEQDCTAMWKITTPEDDEHGKRLIVIPFQRNGDSAIAFPVTFLGHIARIEDFAEKAEPAKRNWHQ